MEAAPQSSANTKKLEAEEWENLKNEYENAIDDLLNQQNQSVQKIQELANSNKSTKVELDKLTELSRSLESQRKLIKEKLKFSELVVKILRKKFHGGNCQDIHNRVEKELKLLEGDFMLLIYSGSYGGDNWGYSCQVIDKHYYCHEWVEGYCYVIAKIKKSGKSINSQDLESLVDKYYREAYNSDKNLIDQAGYIWNKLINDGYRPCLTLVKKSPGGFDHFCYNTTCGTVSYHKWHENKNFLGMVYSSYCCGVRI